MLQGASLSCLEIEDVRLFRWNVRGRFTHQPKTAEQVGQVGQVDRLDRLDRYLQQCVVRSTDKAVKA